MQKKSRVIAVLVGLLMVSILLLPGNALTASAGDQGTVVAWGSNSYGQCRVPAGDFVAVSAGTYHSLAMKPDGTVAAWGDNSYGESSVPAGNYLAVAAGSMHSLGLRADGTLAAWGFDGYGQCDVPAGTYVAVAAGSMHSLALKSDGTLAAWGYNNKGQCDVPAGNFTAIAAGGTHSLALTQEGTVVAWGDNSYGQCNVPAGSFAAISAGGGHSLALKSEGTLAAWGLNSNGQCNVPAGSFAAISAGYMNSLARKSDGSLAAWGMNSSGQCNVPSGKDYAAISAGGTHGLAVRKPAPVKLTPVVNSVSPARGRAGDEVTISGANFGAARGASSVCFCTVSVADYTAWSDTAIQCRVPAGAAGAVPVKVTTEGGTSNAAQFEVQKLTGTTLAAPASVQYSDSLSIMATVLDEDGNAVAGQAVTFSLGDMTAEALTDAAGAATWSTTADLPAGACTAKAGFAGDGTYLPSSAEAQVTVERENLTLKYSGDTMRASNQGVALSAAVDEEEDGAPGDISKAPVVFEIWNQQGKVRDVASALTVSSHGHATAAATCEPLPSNFYTVKVRLADNDFYAAGEAGAELVVYNPKAFIAGGGLIFGDRVLDFFGVSARYCGPPSAAGLKGNMFFVELAFARQPVAIAATQFATLVTPKDGVACLTGSCTFNGSQGHTFRLSIEDKGWFRGDALGLTVRNANNEVVFQADRVIRWGNVVVRQ
jgi:IPT/TIG domain/Regulator of chromosome condensation (RCC1) repeat/Bacterial Ig-like domain (group 3)